MKPYIKKATKVSPKIDFNNETGILELSGRSLPEQSYELYKPLIDWIDEYTAAPHTTTVLNVRLEYINSSSNKYILLFLKKLDDFYKSGHEVKVNWYYDQDDEDAYETVQEYQEILSLPINIQSETF